MFAHIQKKKGLNQLLWYYADLEKAKCYRYEFLFTLIFIHIIYIRESNKTFFSPTIAW